MRFKKIFAAVCAAAVALSSLTFTASAAAVTAVPSGTEKVLYAADLKVTSASDRWAGMDNVTIKITDTSIMTNSNVYAKLVVNSFGDYKDDTTGGVTPAAEVLKWNGISDWLNCVVWYNNYSDTTDTEKDHVSGKNGEFRVNFVPCVTDGKIISYVPISDFNLDQYDQIGGNLQNGAFLSVELSSLEIVEFTASEEPKPSDPDPKPDDKDVVKIELSTGISKGAALEADAGGSSGSPIEVPLTGVDASAVKKVVVDFDKTKITTDYFKGVIGCNDTAEVWQASDEFEYPKNETWTWTLTNGVKDGLKVQFYWINKVQDDTNTPGTAAIKSVTLYGEGNNNVLAIAEPKAETEEPKPDDPKPEGKKFEGSIEIKEKESIIYTYKELIGDLDPKNTTVTFDKPDDINYMGYSDVAPSYWSDVKAPYIVDVSKIQSATDTDGTKYEIKLLIQPKTTPATITWVATEGGAAEKPDDPAGSTATVLWEGSTDFGAWANSVQISNSKLGTLKAGDKLVCYFTPSEGAQLSIKYTDTDWPGLPDFGDAEWHCVALTTSPYTYTLTAKDIAALGTFDLIVGGQKAVATKVELVTTTDTPGTDTPGTDTPGTDTPGTDTPTTPSGSTAVGTLTSPTTPSTDKEDTAKFESKDTDIKVDAPKDAFDKPEEVKFNAAPVADETKGETFTFDLSFTDKDGNKVQPKTAVTVSVPLPAALTNKTVFVYHVEDNGKYTEISCKVENGMVVFTASSFSKYVITSEKLTADGTPAPAEPGNENSGSTTPDNSGNSGTNPGTGVALSLLPVALATAGVVVSRKRK